MTPNELNAFGKEYLPGRFGIRITGVGSDGHGSVSATLDVCKALMAPNDCLHGGAVMVLADTAAGYGCLLNLPPGASSFLTSEMKANHLTAVKGGSVNCVAKPLHLGRTTQVWDAVMSEAATGKLVALFRCTQLLLYPRAPSP